MGLFIKLKHVVSAFLDGVFDTESFISFVPSSVGDADADADVMLMMHFYRPAASKATFHSTQRIIVKIVAPRHYYVIKTTHGNSGHNLGTIWEHYYLKGSALGALRDHSDTHCTSLAERFHNPRSAIAIFDVFLGDGTICGLFVVCPHAMPHANFTP